MTCWDWAVARGQCLREARRLLDCSADAEDAAQEAVIRAWRMRDRCREPARPTPWLAQIARNEAHRERDRAGHGKLFVGEFSDRPDNTDWPAHSLLRIDVARALGRLTPDDRALVGLRYVLDLTQPQIAELLNIPEGTAKVRLHRARVALHAALGEEGDRYD